MFILLLVLLYRYYGEKVNRLVSPGSKKRCSDDPIISTVYDDPKATDETDTLLERKNPHNVKYRTLSKQ